MTKKTKRTKWQTKIYEKLHRKQKIEQNESHRKPEVNLGVSECADCKVYENIEQFTTQNKINEVDNEIYF